MSYIQAPKTQLPSKQLHQELSEQKILQSSYAMGQAWPEGLRNLDKRPLNGYAHVESGRMPIPSDTCSFDNGYSASAQSFPLYKNDSNVHMTFRTEITSAGNPGMLFFNASGPPVDSRHTKHPSTRSSVVRGKGIDVSSSFSP